jgi:hypothetical protein
VFPPVAARRAIRPKAAQLIPARRLVPLVLCGIGALAGSAHAAGPAQAPSSAIAEYVEMVPTATGAQAVGARTTRIAKLPSRIAKQIQAQAGSAAPTLEKVATSSAYGAPPIPARPATTKANTSPPAGKPPAAGTHRAAAPGRPLPPFSLHRTLALVLPDSWPSSLLSAFIGLGIVTLAALAALRRR